MSEAPGNGDIEVLLDYLRRNRGFDFTGYKRSSLTRRIDKRMQAIGISSYLDYVDRLEVVPDEFTQLFNTILINVTNFFRDPPAWEYVAEEVLPQILSSRRPGEPLRMWSAGCASGQEAYTLAMLCAEVLGVEGFRDRVKIYATDVDEEALNQARSARYTPKEVEGVPPDLLERYFERNGQGNFVFSKDLRRSVIFGRHDLIQDAPISRIDLLVCRNTLMYFNSEIQAHILGRFTFALREGGYLFLGKAEMLLAHAGLFNAVDLKRRVFRQVPQPGLRERLMAIGDPGHANPGPPLPREERTREAALDAGVQAQLVVDSAGYLVLANAKARSLFHLSDSDVGKLFQDLEVSYRPVELRSKIQQAYIDRKPSPVYETEWPTGMGDVAHLEVQTVPLVDNNQNLLGTSISFVDVTRSKRFQQELEHTNQELEDAYAELQSTNEELETTNEELQSTVEELETTNEELQSTNEELETMNEEMQSTNEELQTINDELSQRTSDLNQVNAFLESIWASLGAVTVLDDELRVLVWNQRAEDLWGVRPEEVQGQHFLNLDIGLPISKLVPALRSVLTGDEPQQALVVDAVNRRGKRIRVRVTSTPLLGTQKDIRGVIVITEEEAAAETSP